MSDTGIVETIAMRLQLRLFSRYRPRMLTMVVLLLVAAPTVLANLTSEWVVDPQPTPSGMLHIQRESGWPLVWRWDNSVVTPATVEPADPEYSGVRLAANLAIWLLVLAAPTCICEWLLRRYRPRLRWSLRTMLVAVAAFAVACAWFTAARKRANLQDALIARMRARSESVWVKRGGPRWLSFLGVERFFRRIARANVRVSYSDQKADDDLEILDSLLRLPDLQSLDLRALHDTPAIAEKLRGMRSPNLRSLYLEVSRLSPDIIAGLRELPRL